MGTKKQYLKTKPICKVTFHFKDELVNKARKVNLVGEFNNWDERGIAMKKLQTGEFTTTIDLNKGREYQYRYLVDGSTWSNDQDADKYAPNEFQQENSVVIV